MLRGLTALLDDALPVVPGCQINDDPLAPLCRACRTRVAEEGDALPIAWLPRERRLVEKLATPDVTIADMIGDVDPIKAVRGGLELSDELTMHYGLLPRAHRCIFAINELPDLAGKIQVGLFQHPPGGRCPDQRLPDPAAPRRRHDLHGEPRGLHGTRQDHHAAQGPRRVGDPHTLPADPPGGDGDHGAGSLGRAGRRRARHDRDRHPVLYQRDRRGGRLRGA